MDCDSLSSDLQSYQSLFPFLHCSQTLKRGITMNFLLKEGQMVSWMGNTDQPGEWKTPDGSPVMALRTYKQKSNAVKLTLMSSTFVSVLTYEESVFWELEGSIGLVLPLITGFRSLVPFISSSESLISITGDDMAVFSNLKWEEGDCFCVNFNFFEGWCVSFVGGPGRLLPLGRADEIFTSRLIVWDRVGWLRRR